MVPWVPEVFLARRMEMAAEGRWHCTSGYRLVDPHYFDNVMTKFMINNRTDA